MTDPVQAAIVDFTNNSDKPLNVSVVIGGTEHHVVTLAPGDSIRQVTPGQVEWRFNCSADGAAESDSGVDVNRALALPTDEGEGPGGSKGGNKGYE